jgi:RND family efflux transporter MFP subunit
MNQWHACVDQSDLGLLSAGEGWVRVRRMKKCVLCFWAIAWMLMAGVAQAQWPRVVVAPVRSEPVIEEIVLNGTVSTQQQAALSVPVGGLVEARNVEVGDRVRRDDVLLRLDDELAGLEQAGASAATREAEQRLEEARRLLEQARSAGGIRVIAETEKTRRASEVDIAEAALVRARAAEALQRARLNRHVLRAPFDGIVSARNVDVGEWVSPGDAVYTLVNTSDLLLDFQVPQQAFGRIDEQVSLMLALPGAGHERVSIVRWLPLSDTQARTFLLRALPPDGALLMPGMAVSAVLRMTRHATAYSVPRDAINRFPDGRITVWVLEPVEGEEGVSRVREQAVEVVGASGANLFVEGALAEGQRVVVRGNESLRPHEKVLVMED